MAPLNSALRGALERSVIAAREAAEQAASAALATLAVGRDDAFTTHTPEQRSLRVALRARAKQLGGGDRVAGLPLLAEEIAYEQWHQMLFARFLIENDLLMRSDGISLSMEDCEYEASVEGHTDPWQYAARIAGGMLPGIFRSDDPSMQVRLAAEGRTALESILAGLPSAVFMSDDALGWVYQFWQSKQKDAVNASERKIGGADLAPVTQLFTEDYMVRFLLENSLGAWWAARHPESPLVATFTYLRRMDDGTPAAGTFPGWPKKVAEVTVMDPCCGSGHFLVAAFEMLRQMRMEEEGLGAAEAADATLRDNLYGLELDARCIQIAAFALVLAAWKAGGHRMLPVPNLACSGIPVSGQLDEWTKLAGNDPDLRNSLERLYHLFRNAPDLGSLIDPTNVPLQDRMFAPDFSKVGPLLDRALALERAIDDPVAAVFGEAARGIAHAADLLGRRYTLVTTNVPYLARSRQSDALKEFNQRHHPNARADLATAFLERCQTLTSTGGSQSIVTPQNWLFLGSYKTLRESQIVKRSWNLLVRLGHGAFEAVGGHVVNVALLILSNVRPLPDHIAYGVDVSNESSARQKAEGLVVKMLLPLDQSAQLRNPDARILFEAYVDSALLINYARSFQGIKTGDDPRFVRYHWEIPRISASWRRYHGAPNQESGFSGCDQILAWDPLLGRLPGLTPGEIERSRNRDKQGKDAWGSRGVIVGAMHELPVGCYTGEAFNSNTAVIIPRNPMHLPAIWAYCSSSEYPVAVRRIDHSLKVTNLSLTKVPFDLEQWQRIASEAGPLPEPYSNDPTQWLFNGDPADSTEPLQVAVARLVGYRWPKQEADHLNHFADDDGIVPLVPVAGEEPAAERLRSLLNAAYGDAWSADRLDYLLREVGYGGKGLDGWLRDGFFEQHVKLFQQRPFIWHVWDGRRSDGFSALVNYHKLDDARLGKLIHTYLGGWIRAQRDAVDAGVPGAEDRLVRAEDLRRKLEAIRQGEPPYDIFVRWKPLHEQPIGWNPDLNDGVRLNIRPFVKAGVLRSRVNVKWEKDRGKNPDGSERHNDKHLTVAEKQAARAAAGA